MINSCRIYATLTIMEEDRAGRTKLHKAVKLTRQYDFVSHEAICFLYAAVHLFKDWPVGATAFAAAIIFNIS
jgi:hypothetical protein